MKKLLFFLSTLFIISHSLNASSADAAIAILNITSDTNKLKKQLHIPISQTVNPEAVAITWINILANNNQGAFLTQDAFLTQLHCAQCRSKYLETPVTTPNSTMLCLHCSKIVCSESCKSTHTGSDAHKQNLENANSRTCFFCKKTSTNNFQRCAACHKVYYCSEECQKNDWKNNHKRSCPTFASFDNPLHDFVPLEITEKLMSIALFALLQQTSRTR